MELDDDILGRVVFTPAEKAVLIEQIQSAQVTFDAFRKAVETGHVKKMILSWSDVMSCYETIGNILNNKSQRAIREAFAEHQGL